VRNIIATLFCRSRGGNHVIGTHTSIERPVSTPVNPAGATPTTV
jgi:superfamily I DNA and RNA helicase